jgi:hypothetical protein
LIQLLSSGLPKFCEQKHRSKGVHLSSILQDIYYRDGKGLPDDDLLTHGRLFEDAIARNYEIEFPGEYEHNIEVLYRGIYGTIDFLQYSPIRVHDIKHTARSSKGMNVPIGTIVEPDHPIYGSSYVPNWVQICCYSTMLLSGPREAEGVLCLCHNKGDYKGLKVDYNRWLRRFYKDESIATWNMIESHAIANFCYTCGEKKGNCLC